MVGWRDVFSWRFHFISVSDVVVGCFFPTKSAQIQTKRPRALGDAEMRGVAAAALRVDAPHYPVIAPWLLKDR